jgi:murein endopeptidase
MFFRWLFLFFCSFEAFAFFSLPPCGPESQGFDFFQSQFASSDFCAVWNPDFFSNGNRCCAPLMPAKKIPPRFKFSSRGATGYCQAMTPEQKQYWRDHQEGRLGDILLLLQKESEEQAFCSFSNGFLVHGKPVLGTSENHLLVRSQGRCLNFGIDAMVGLLEWVGREIGKIYSDAQWVIGDIAAPRGGRIFGKSGKRSHISHTSGQDADVGFLKDARTNFHLERNWVLLKKIFRNPWACVQGVFLDRRHIARLRRFASEDPDWKKFSSKIKHIPGHSDHFHIRIARSGCRLSEVQMDDVEVVE